MAVAVANWGQLWDPREREGISYHTQKGIEFLETYGTFVKERATIEEEYASKLRTLIKKYTPKKREEDETPFSYNKAFQGVLRELGDLAGQHETVHENFRNEILRDVAATSKQLKEERKTHLSEAERLHQELLNSVEAMVKSRKDYSKAWKEAEAALMKYERADKDMHLSRAEVEKAKQNSLLKTQAAEDAKSTYALQLQNANQRQSEHYHQKLPCVMENLRMMDEKRIDHLRRLIDRSVQLERCCLPIIEKCLDGMASHAAGIDPRTDSEIVVNRYRTGYAPPGPFPFEDLSNPQHSSVSSGGTDGADTPSPFGNGTIQRLPSRISSKLGRRNSQKLLFGGHKLQTLLDTLPSPNSVLKNHDYQEDYSDLPPSQRCQKLKKKIANIDKELATKTQSRDGLVKMAQVYQTNPKLGDVNTVQEQLEQYNRELESLTAQLNRFQGFLQEAQSQMNVPIDKAAGLVAANSPRPPNSQRSSASLPSGTVKPSSHNNTSERTSLSEDSLSSDGSALGGGSAGVRGTVPPPPSSGTIASANRGVIGSHASTSSPQHQKNGGVAGHPPPPPGSSASPGSGVGGESGYGTAAIAEQEIYNDVEPLPILGTATASYTFDGGSDGTLRIQENEELLLIEKDEGDGWTRVRRQHPQAGDEPDEGFAPTSYLICKWYPD